MCTACYSKMQREKKKGEAGYCDRPPTQEPEADSQLSVRGARPASTAARKFIEEFARNKGASETASARQDGSSRQDIHVQEPVSTQHTAYGAAVLLGAAPRGISEGLFAKAQFGVGIAGAHILQRDPIIASSRTMRYMTDHTCSTGNGEEMRMSRNLSPGDGPYPLAAPWPDFSHGRNIDHEDPSVLQGASNLMLLTQQSSPHEVLITLLWRCHILRMQDRLLNLAYMQNISDAKYCTPGDSTPGLPMNSGPQLTVGALRMALTIGANEEPGQKQYVTPYGMNLCTSRTQAGGVIAERLLAQDRSQTVSAPAMLSAPVMQRGSGHLWEGSVASSNMAASTVNPLQDRLQSGPFH